MQINPMCEEFFGGGTVKKHVVVGAIIAKQYGKVVSIQGYERIASISANVYTELGNIGDLLKPTDVIRGSCIIGENAYGNGDVAYLAVGTDGKVNFTAPTSRTNWFVRVSITYIGE